MKQWDALSATAKDGLAVLLLFVLGAAMYLSGLYPVFGTSTHSSLAARFGVLALLGAATLLRRRPLLALTVGMVPLGIDVALGATVPVVIGYGDLIYAACLYGSRRVYRGVIAICVAVTIAITVAVIVTIGDARVAVLAVLLAYAILGTPIWWALSARHHKDTAETERARVQAMTLVAELDRRAAIDDERKTMARDLHDVIAGHLSAIAIQSEAALGVLARHQVDPAITGVLGSIRANSVSALQEMRTMIGLLRRDDGAEEVAAPRGLAQLPIVIDAARAAGIVVHVRNSLDDTILPSAVDQAAYRIIQEGLTNVMKHAPGCEVDIDVRTEFGALAVSVRNPLAPKPPARDEHPRRGLLNMHERAAALGGNLTAGTDSGHWVVRARLPLLETSELA
ncbi:sensor histidine kinase [Nocardia sp. NPDC051570]|uniref:sensor histidine kinase n=1 Tax=Nocardia sp. NPDC051570 TaxID=3364324 RepID=UPI0037B5B93F